MSEHPCAWRGCGMESTVRLWFGTTNTYNGKPCPGVNYCDDHGEQVRAMFIIGDEGDPDDGPRYLHRARARAA